LSVRGAILLVGTELLSGTIADRNVPIVAAALVRKGVPVVRVETVPDELDAIAAAARRLAGAADLLVVTGGLGPTADDVTREALARALGTGIRVDEEIRAAIERRLAARGLPVGESAVRQASFPEGTEPVANPVGSAPGFRGALGACRFWVLPGVPPETAVMIGALVDGLPEPRPGWGWERLVATVGMSEVRAETLLAAGGFAPPPGAALAFLPGPAGVKLRVFAPDGAPNDALDAAERAMRGILGGAALPRAGLPESLVRELALAGRTLATAESCTGGLVGARITDVPGASSVYLGGIVSYSDRAKVARLGVAEDLLERHGAVSEPVARAMAEGVRAAFEASIGVAVTGIAGPGGGTEAKPVGMVWLAVTDREGTESRRFDFPGSREMVRERSAHKALEMAYRRVRPA
jgi:nicotinamide-nucleotide amidase